MMSIRLHVKIIIDTQQRTVYDNNNMKTLEQEDFFYLGYKLLMRRKIEGECWIWTGGLRCTNSGPRGVVNVGSRDKKTHARGSLRRYIVPRVAYRIWVGELEPGKEICHKCDRTLCFRPEHLFQGTHSDNIKDAVAKGAKFGAKPGQARKLNQSLVKEIRDRRASGESGPSIAKSLKIHYKTVYKVAKGKSWGWV